MSAWGRLSFSVVMLSLAILTFVGVVGLRLLGAGVYALAFLILPIGAGGWYLYENREHPPIDLGPPATSPAPGPGNPTDVPPGGTTAPNTDPSAAGGSAPPPEEPMPSADEPFDDPVELADRLDSAPAPGGPDAGEGPETTE